jgi:hypothetical protein
MTTPAPRTLPPHTFRLLAVYALGIALALVALEGVIRARHVTPRKWYPLVASTGQPVRTIFVGSSRVQAAIETSLVTAALPAAEGRQDISVGQGFSTIIEHTLGLRLLARQGLLRGATVFVEAPGGIPDTSRWTDRWYYSEMPDFLLAVIEAGDMPGLWRSSMTREDKIAATVRGSLRASQLFTYHELIRVEFLTDVDHRFREWARRLAPRTATPTVTAPPAPPSTAAPTSTPDTTMREGGGVRTDLDDRERIRAEAVREGQRMLRDQERVTDWDTRVIATLVKTVRDGGGTVVFFETPLSAPMRIASETAVGVANRRDFLAQAARWGSTVVPLSRVYDDTDFPDVWHLSVSAGHRFTAELVAAWRR